MNSKTQCSKTVLAGESGCRVTYCHDCRVAEIEVGSVSLRLKEDAFRLFQHLIDNAVSGLDAAQANHALFAGDTRRVH
jgi:hypothetical protein